MRPLLALALALACSGEAPPAQPRPASTANSGPTETTAPSNPADASARYQLRFRDVPVGYVELATRRRAGGFQLRRSETLVVERDGVRVDTHTVTTVETDGDLEARRVHVVSQMGELTREISAERDPGGWTIAHHGGATMRTGPDLGIFALAALRPGPRRSVLVPGAGFARVDLRATARDGGLSVELQSTLGRSRTEIIAGAGGLPASWRSDTGESAVRIEGERPPELAPAPLLALAAMPGRGRRTSTLRISGADRALPPTVASQRARLDGGDWVVEFHRPAAAVPPELAALVREVADRLEDDLGLPGLGGDEALRMGRGDCTGHASALSLLARRRGYAASLATGYRRAGRRWLRHRWVAVELDGEVIFVDPSFREPRPRPDQLLALAIHGDAPESIAAADLVAFSGMTGAVAAFE